MDRHPRGAAERVADDVLHGHVGREVRAVVDVRRLAVGRVGARHVVVVAAQHDGSREAPVGNGPVEGLCDPGAPLAVGIEDARLRTDDQPVAAGLADPVDVVVELPGDLGRRRGADLLQYFGGEAVGKLEVFGAARSADPAERAEAVVEEHRPHDVLHIGGITETAALAHHGSPGARGFQQEGVAIVEEIHPPRGEFVDGGAATPARTRGSGRAPRPSSCSKPRSLRPRGSSRPPRGCGARSGRNPGLRGSLRPPDAPKGRRRCPHRPSRPLRGHGRPRGYGEPGRRANRTSRRPIPARSVSAPPWG